MFTADEAVTEILCAFLCPGEGYYCILSVSGEFHIERDGLARRPLHTPAAEKVYMQMLYALPALVAGVYYESEPLFGKAFVRGKLLCDLGKLPDSFGIGLYKLYY